MSWLINFPPHLTLSTSLVVRVQMTECVQECQTRIWLWCLWVWRTQLCPQHPVECRQQSSHARRPLYCKRYPSLSTITVIDRHYRRVLHCSVSWHDKVRSHSKMWQLCREAITWDQETVVRRRGMMGRPWCASGTRCTCSSPSGPGCPWLVDTINAVFLLVNDTVFWLVSYLITDLAM